MPELPLLTVSLAELRAHNVRLSPDEAIAVVLAAGERLNWQMPSSPMHAIVLCSDGCVGIRNADDAEACGAAAYARLLHSLLPEAGAGGVKVAGGVRVLIARATGQTELPPVAGVEQFAEKLQRFAPPSIADAIVAVMVRWADRITDVLDRPASNRGERRRSGPSVSQMREFLRESDLERYALRRRLSDRSGTPDTPVSRATDRRHPSTSRSSVADAATAVAPSASPRAPLVFPVDERVTSKPWLAPVAVAVLAVSSAGFAGSVWKHWPAPHDSRSMAHAASAAAVVDATAPHINAVQIAAPIETAVEASDIPAPVATTSRKPSRTRALEPLRTAYSGIYSPAFGPDERSVFFHADDDGASRLVRAETDDDGEIIRQATLIDNGARNYHVRPSPDGQLLAFDSDEEGARGVYIADQAGRNVRRVTGPGYAALPTWAPDSRHLSFVRAEPKQPAVWNLWVLDLETGRERRLTSYRSGQVWPGSWFSDGHRVAYTHETTLFVLDTKSGARRAFESPVPRRLVRTAAVAPDDRRIAFQVYRDGMWLLDTKTGSMRRVLQDRSAEEFSWSRDGQRVAFHSRRNGQWGVWLMRAPVEAR